MENLSIALRPKKSPHHPVVLLGCGSFDDAICYYAKVVKASEDKLFLVLHENSILLEKIRLFGETLGEISFDDQIIKAKISLSFEYENTLIAQLLYKIEVKEFDPWRLHT